MRKCVSLTTPAEGGYNEQFKTYFYFDASKIKNIWKKKQFGGTYFPVPV
ncbi:MAG: hypothetical protein KTR30_24545 [Saprospiraceae bacterium]|nr:hypothetical protein [Saprospiraceae bacterium]